MKIAEIEKRLSELREHSSQGDPFDWDDVEYLRLLGVKLRMGYATNFNFQWFLDMAEKLAATLRHAEKAEAILSEYRDKERLESKTRLANISARIQVTESMPEPHRLVIVSGGVAVWTGSVWLSKTGDDSNRVIDWAVTWWMPIPCD